MKASTADSVGQLVADGTIIPYTKEQQEKDKAALYNIWKRAKLASDSDIDLLESLHQESSMINLNLYIYRGTGTGHLQELVFMLNHKIKRELEEKMERYIDNHYIL
jgi:hypothetical protein